MNKKCDINRFWVWAVQFVVNDGIIFSFHTLNDLTKTIGIRNLIFVCIWLDEDALWLVFILGKMKIKLQEIPKLTKKQIALKPDKVGAFSFYYLYLFVSLFLFQMGTFCNHLRLNSPAMKRIGWMHNTRRKNTAT